MNTYYHVLNLQSPTFKQNSPSRLTQNTYTEYCVWLTVVKWWTNGEIYNLYLLCKQKLCDEMELSRFLWWCDLLTISVIKNCVITVCYSNKHNELVWWIVTKIMFGRFFQNVTKNKHEKCNLLKTLSVIYTWLCYNLHLMI